MLRCPIAIIFYRQKMGQGLNDLSFQDLRNLEKDIESASKVIHDRAARYSAQFTALLGFYTKNIFSPY
jgi:flagellar capping protein FliD